VHVKSRRPRWYNRDFPVRPYNSGAHPIAPLTFSPERAMGLTNRKTLTSPTIVVLELGAEQLLNVLLEVPRFVPGRLCPWSAPPTNLYGRGRRS
jgi:hypothetical protein